MSTRAHHSSPSSASNSPSSSPSSRGSRKKMPLTSPARRDMPMVSPSPARRDRLGKKGQWLNYRKAPNAYTPSKEESKQNASDYLSKIRKTYDVPIRNHTTRLQLRALKRRGVTLSSMSPVTPEQSKVPEDVSEGDVFLPHDPVGTMETEEDDTTDTRSIATPLSPTSPQSLQSPKSFLSPDTECSMQMQMQTPNTPMSPKSPPMIKRTQCDGGMALAQHSRPHGYRSTPRILDMILPKDLPHESRNMMEKKDAEAENALMERAVKNALQTFLSGVDPSAAGEGNDEEGSGDELYPFSSKVCATVDEQSVDSLVEEDEYDSESEEDEHTIMTAKTHLTAKTYLTASPKSRTPMAGSPKSHLTASPKFSTVVSPKSVVVSPPSPATPATPERVPELPADELYEKGVKYNGIEIFARKRSLFPNEKRSSNDVVSHVDNVVSVDKGKKNLFRLPCTGVFDGSVSYDDVYDISTKHVVRSVEGGIHATCIVFGPEESDSFGVMSTIEDRVCNDVFRFKPVGVSVQFVELIGLQCTDLLEKGNVKVVDKIDGSVSFLGASEVNVLTPQELASAITRGKRVAKNEESSTTVLRISVVNDKFQTGVLSLVYCAGFNTDTKLQEETQRSMQACFRARASGKKATKPLPYDSSPLTRILRKSLKRNDSQFSVIATVSPVLELVEETVSTLSMLGSLVSADHSQEKSTERLNSNDLKRHIDQRGKLLEILKKKGLRTGAIKITGS